MLILTHYVNAVFEQKPNTPEMIKLKQDMLLNMEKHYTTLLAENFTEQEALARVLAEYGQIEDYLGKETHFSEELTSDENILNWSKSEVEEFKTHRSRFSLAIALGVSLILFAPALSLFVQGLSSYLPFLSSLQSNQLILVSLIPLFILISTAVGLFIIFGIKEQSFGVEGKIILLDPSTRSNLMQEMNEFKHSFAKGITTGVLFCFAGLIFLLFPLILFESERFWPLIFLLSFVSAGVFLLVFFGIIHSTYNKILSIGDYTPQRVASERMTTKVANIIFPLAAGIYVISGLLFNTWSPGWMIFPILGISFGIFAAIAENSNLFFPKK
ncbi:MAG: hypothetical protein WBA84_05715 [Carnobacterium sp.]|uniref:hypothetical protein n=1 Tax=Carnobacterium sp. TaxID=48221 RepID=UPI003C70E5A2